MASGSTSPSSASPSLDPALVAAQARYRYMPWRENQMAPICMAKSWPWLAEQYGPSWILPFLPKFFASQARHLLQRLRYALQRATFRFDKLSSYNQLFAGPLPPFAREWPHMTAEQYDAAFGWWRIAGANPLLLSCERDLGSLRARIPLPVERIEARLLRVLGRRVSLDEEARSSRLFVTDFRLLLEAVQWERSKVPRDSRWGEKYLPAPIGVFLAPSDTACGLLPLAIQIDQPQPNSEYNPVYTPDDGWGWIIAKAYFEAADVTWQSGFGHVFSTHLVMEPFSMATPRQLPPRHPVHLLLQPHTRFTLTTNQAAYRYLVDRSKLYSEIYTATLEQLRTVAIRGYLERRFTDLQLEADLARRGVQNAPACYPYRDDLRLWLEPIRSFVSAYVEAFYTDDAAVQADSALQAWKEELIDPERGAVRELVPGDRLDSRQKLVGLLAQVLFTAGPGHAAQHYSADYYYRFTPAFPAAAYVPPPRQTDPLDFAAWLSVLPSIDRASDQFRSNTYTSYRYDRFGSYGRFPLGSLPQAREPIARLQSALADVEATIEQRQAARLFPYEFGLPSRVPNSVNI
jgi:arachidonate 15-lipoxygenase